MYISSTWPRVLLCTIALTFFSIDAVFAQKKERATKVSKFGKISKEDFDKLSFGADTAAGAVKLFDVGKCDFTYNSGTGLKYLFERHVRYKILNQNGYDLADLEIPLYKSSDNRSRERVTNLHAASYNLEGGKINETKPQKDAKFTESYNKNYTIQRVTLPNVKEESIIEFKYTIESDFLFNLQSWRFQGSVPTLYSEYAVTIPEFLIYKQNQTGYFPVTIINEGNVNAHYFPGVNAVANRKVYIAENVPALRDEPFIASLDDYISKVEFELRATKFPNDTYKDLTGNWSKITSELAQDENFGKYANNRAFTRGVLPEILGDEADTLEIAKRVYNYVKSNIQWNKENRLYASATNPRTVFAKKSGNSADINLALLGLLKAAGVDAFPVLLSTRKNGMHPGFPIISKFNNVIVATSIGNDFHLLDASDEDLPFGLISYENLSHQGFAFNLETMQGEWVSLEPTSSADVFYSYDLAFGEDMTLSGAILRQSKGYSGVHSRNEYRSHTNQADYISEIRSDRPGLDIIDYQFANLDDIDQPFVETMQVTMGDQIESAGNMFYFSPLFYERTKDNPFKLEERNFPVDFGYPLNEHVRVSITFPEGYTVEKLPKGILYKLPDDAGSFLINHFNENNQVLVVSKIALNKGFYTSEEYFNLKELFRIIVERQAEQIVVKKS